MRSLSSALLALVLALPGLASAEDAAHGSAAHQVAEEQTGHDAHDGHGELTFLSLVKSPDFQGTLVNFGALLLLIAWVIRKKGNPALAARRDEVEKELAEAQRLRAEAQQRHMETATRLERLDREMLQIRGDMIKAGEAERDRIVSQAEEKAARMRKDTAFLIEQQVKQLRKELTQQAATAAVVAAQDLLQQRTTDSDQDQLAEAYLARLDEVIEERQS
ncbi:MAG: hypothetical protein KJO40_20175 [Deltaproteobacteria bacterium]|nr:hypothetical protein [Deltaproteobacteria bacterium]NND27218.1 hypothetical protein [Myxococcales bacterium]MBT8467012.1 hypothetical protein [Deltaproteobacteria bacterium]MBT8483893.1 hypothetical protein [Deltaproteobacteria bacterium]NNK07233.1 hypothetical protein [Myxococcales bacterium]